MLGGFLALLLSYVFFPLGAAAAWLVWSAPALTIRIVHACANIKGGTVYFDLSSYQAWLIIGCIIALWSGRNVIISSIRRRNFRPYAVILLMFCTMMIWVNAVDRLNRRTEIEFRETSSSMMLTIRSPENRWFLIADQLTNYGAQDALAKQILPEPRVFSAAWLDLTEGWMRREFLESGTADDLSAAYLNGNAVGEGIPEKLADGFEFNADGMRLRHVTSFVGKRAWLIEGEGIQLLFPNGVPPERIFTRNGIDSREISLVLLGMRDNKSIWEEFQTESSFCPEIRDFSEDGDVTLVLRRGELAFRNGGL